MIAGPECERMLASASGRAVVQKAHSADTRPMIQWVRSAAGAMIDFMLAVHRVIATAGGIVLISQIAERRIGRHKTVPFGRLERSNWHEVALPQTAQFDGYRFGTAYRVPAATVSERAQRPSRPSIWGGQCGSQSSRHGQHDRRCRDGQQGTPVRLQRNIEHLACDQLGAADPATTATRDTAADRRANSTNCVATTWPRLAPTSFRMTRSCTRLRRVATTAPASTTMPRAIATIVASRTARSSAVRIVPTCSTMAEPDGADHWQVLRQLLLEADGIRAGRRRERRHHRVRRVFQGARREDDGEVEAEAS